MGLISYLMALILTVKVTFWAWQFVLSAEERISPASRFISHMLSAFVFTVPTVRINRLFDIEGVKSAKDGEAVN